MSLDGYALDERVLKKALGGRDRKLSSRASRNLHPLPSDRAAAREALDRWIDRGDAGDADGSIAALALQAICATIGEELSIGELSREDLADVDARRKRLKARSTPWSLFVPPKAPKLPPIEDLPVVGALAGKSLATAVAGAQEIALALRRDRRVKPKPYRGTTPNQVHELVDPRTGTIFRGSDTLKMGANTATMIEQRKGKPPKTTRGTRYDMVDGLVDRLQRGWIWTDPSRNEPIGKDPVSDRFDALVTALAGAKDAGRAVWLFLW